MGPGAHSVFNTRELTLLPTPSSSPAPSCVSEGFRHPENAEQSGRSPLEQMGGAPSTRLTHLHLLRPSSHRSPA